MKTMVSYPKTGELSLREIDTCKCYIDTGFYVEWSKRGRYPQVLLKDDSMRGGTSRGLECQELTRDQRTLLTNITKRKDNDGDNKN